MTSVDTHFDDPAGRTRFAWARTLLVVFVVSLLVERLFFANSPWSLAILAFPLSITGVLTVIRSRQLRRTSTGINAVLPLSVVFAVLVIAGSALVGVAVN